RFMCQFTADAVNAGTGPAPKPQIMVTVVPSPTVGATPDDFLSPVEIIPPGGRPVGLARQRFGARPVSWARRVVVEAGRPQVEPRLAARRAIGGGWERDDPFGEVRPPVGPIGPGGGGIGGGAPLRR